MMFPNAAKGVKKIFTAEILSLIAAFLIIVAAVMALSTFGSIKGFEATQSTAAAAGAFASGIGMAIFSIGSLVLAIIAFIFNILGVVQASRDESTFKIALYALIAGVVFTCLGSIFENRSGPLSGAMSALATVAELIVTLYVIQGIRLLASRLNNREVDNQGQKIYMIILIVLILRLIANILVAIFGGRFTTTLALSFYMASIVLSLVQYIMYLVFLAKGKKMLAQN